MLVGSWTHSSSKGVESFNVASQYFKKHGAVGASIGSLLGKDIGSYVTNIGFENWTHFDLLPFIHLFFSMRQIPSSVLHLNYCPDGLI